MIMILSFCKGDYYSQMQILLFRMRIVLNLLLANYIQHNSTLIALNMTMLLIRSWFLSLN